MVGSSQHAQRATNAPRHAPVAYRDDDCFGLAAIVSSALGVFLKSGHGCKRHVDECGGALLPTIQRSGVHLIPRFWLKGGLP